MSAPLEAKSVPSTLSQNPAEQGVAGEKLRAEATQRRLEEE
jgi:hypothetical protein